MKEHQRCSLCITPGFIRGIEGKMTQLKGHNLTDDSTPEVFPVLNPGFIRGIEGKMTQLKGHNLIDD